MDKKTYIEKIKSSSLSDESKQKIVSLLESGQYSFEMKEQIKDLIQRDIDSGAVEMTDEDRAEIKAAEDQLEQDLTTIKKDLDEDMSFVENEMNNLATTVSEVNKIVDEVKIESLSADIKG